MIVIPISTEERDGETFITPSQPIPVNSIRILVDKYNYVVYEPGDELPVDTND